MLKKAIATTGVIGISLLALTGCKEDHRQESEKTNANIMERAVNSIPVPDVSNFLTRKQVAKWMERQDTPNRAHYVYVLADTGQIIGYYVAQSRPVCTSTFLTPTEKETPGSGANIIQQPALDGTYYGDGACSHYFFFDAETDAMVELNDLKFITMDQPLQIDAPALKVEVDQ